MALNLYHKFGSAVHQSTDYVFPYVDAILNYMSYGNGVFDLSLFNKSNNMTIIVAGSDIKIGQGYASALGYIVRNAEEDSVKRLSSSLYMVGIRLTTVNQISVAEGYASAKRTYDTSVMAADVAYESKIKSGGDSTVAMQAYNVALENAQSIYDSAIAGLGNNVARFMAYDTASEDPIEFSGGGKMNSFISGDFDVFVPLWRIKGTTAEVINPITPGIPKEARNLRPDGFVNGVPFSELFNDFRSETPGVRFADRAVKADVATHLYANRGDYALSGSLRIGGDSGGFLRVCKKLGTVELSKDRPNGSVPFSVPSGWKAVLVEIYGKTGTLLISFDPSAGSGKYGIDAYDASYARFSVMKNAGMLVFEFSEPGNEDLDKGYNFYEYLKMEVYMYLEKVA